VAFKVVGIAAMARHGKDTVAEALVALGYERISLADKLKEEVAGMFEGHEGFDLETLMHGDKGPLQRRVLQIWGTEARREVFPDFWIWQWCVKALACAVAGKPGVVLADVRFHNEADYVHLCGGVLIGVDRGDFRDPDTDYSHASERHIPEILAKADYTIDNTGSLEKFNENVSYALDELRLKPDKLS